tara:strand:- start:1528 stop:1743 length:216 start_codon:yes stop_codon:yes gene_type:complete
LSSSRRREAFHIFLGEKLYFTKNFTRAACLSHPAPRERRRRRLRRRRRAFFAEEDEATSTREALRSAVVAT